MKKKDKQLFKSFSIYTIGSVAGQAVPFFLLPVLTRYLTPADYGIVATFRVLVSLAIPIVGINTTRAVARNYFDHSKESLSVYIGNCILIMLSSFFVVFIMSLALSQIASSWLKMPASIILVTPIVAAGTFLSNLALTIWRVKDKPVTFTTFSLSMLSMEILISIVLIVIFAMNWRGRIIGISFSTLMFGIIAFLILLSQGYIKFLRNKEYITDALKFGYPLIFQKAGEWMQNSLNRIFLTALVGLTSTGLFSVGNSIASGINVFVGAFQQAWVPWMYKTLKRNNKTENLRIVKFIYLLNFGVFIAAITFGMIASFFMKWYVGEQYSDASKYVLWLSLAYAINGMQQMMQIFILYEKRTILLMWTSLLSGITGTAMTYILIKLNGALGAAHAMVLTFSLNYCLTWYIASRVHPMPWRSMKLFAAIKE